MANRSICVYLVIPQTLFRECLAEKLSADARLRVIAAATALEARDAPSANPDGIMLVDLEGPNAPGPAFVSEMREAGFQGPILALASGNNYAALEQWLAEGGSGIFLKQESVAGLIGRIHGLADGEFTMDETSLTVIRKRMIAAEKIRPLTARETAVLEAASRGLSNKQIAEQLNITLPLVKAALRQLFSKTGAQGRAQLVRLAMEQYGLS